MLAWDQSSHGVTCYRNHHLRRHNANMDNVPGSFCGLKKDIERLWKKNKPRTDRSGAGGHGEGVDPASPPPQAETHVVAGDRHGLEGNGANADPRSVDDERRGPVVDRTDVSQCPDIEVVVGSGHNRGGNDASGQTLVKRSHLSPSTASIPSSGKPESM